MFALYVRSIPPREMKLPGMDMNSGGGGGGVPPQDFVKVSPDDGDGEGESPLLKEALDEARDAILEMEKKEEEETMEL